MNTNPLKKDQEIVLNIKRIGINGEGIGYYKRLAVFVDGALPGETVVVKITKVFDRYSLATIVKFKEQSADRLNPTCPYFKSCGGCSLQHTSYENSLKLKEQILKESFESYFDGQLEDSAFRAIIPSTSPFNYRYKSKLPIRYDGEKLVSGMYESSSNRLVYIDKCNIEDQYLSMKFRDVLDYLTKYQIIAFNPKSKDGVLRHVILRRSKCDDNYQVVLILYKDDERTINVAKGLTKVSRIESVYVSINNDLEANENITKDIRLVAGKPHIVERINHTKFELYPESYFILNMNDAENYYNEIIKIAHVKETDKVIDAYSGIGTIGLLLSGYVKEVRGLDNDKQMVKAAINNAKLNSIPNATFYNGDMVDNLGKWHKKDFDADTIIVNPNKNGMDLRMINFLQNSGIKKIIYCSSNPATLAKNCNHLNKAYHILSIQPFDLMPYTSNVECVVSLERR